MHQLVRLGACQPAAGAAAARLLPCSQAQARPDTLLAALDTALRAA